MSSDGKRSARIANKRPKDDTDSSAADESPTKKVKPSKIAVEAASPLTPPPSSPVIGDESSVTESSQSNEKSSNIEPTDGAHHDTVESSSTNVEEDKGKQRVLASTSDTTQQPTRPSIKPTEQREVMSFTSRCDANWTVQLRTRMESMLLSSDLRDDRYNVFALQKSDTRWITYGHESNTQYLAVDANPIKFWIIGEVDTRGAWLVGQNGSPLKSVSIRVRPVRIGEIEKWRTLLNALGGYRVSDVTANGYIKARRRMAYQSKGQTAPSSNPWYECYDATRKMRPYALMDKWETHNIGVNDLVVVDARLTRWQCDDKGKTKYYGEWKQWRVGFELHAVSMLFQGPDEIVDEVVQPTSNVDFEY